MGKLYGMWVSQAVKKKQLGLAQDYKIQIKAKSTNNSTRQQ